MPVTSTDAIVSIVNSQLNKMSIHSSVRGGTSWILLDRKAAASMVVGSAFPTLDGLKNQEFGKNRHRMSHDGHCIVK